MIITCGSLKACSKNPLKKATVTAVFCPTPVHHGGGRGYTALFIMTTTASPTANPRNTAPNSAQNSNS
ncbi:MAG: hypothetical protein U1C58_06130 [Flavobacteriaceae bacterium]|nr:hypothetical protein [Flavobacteriaceae bacterium]